MLLLNSWCLVELWGRGLEYIFINQISKKFNIKDLRIRYIKTSENEPFIKFRKN